MKSPDQETAMRNKVEEEVHRQFRPEFLNRIDDIIIFHALEITHIKRIIEIQLKKLTAMLSERGLTVEISDQAKEFLAREGYDPAFGARPLKRTLQKEIIDTLAIRLLEGKFKPGDTVFVNMRDGAVEMSGPPSQPTVTPSTRPPVTPTTRPDRDADHPARP